MENGYYLFRKVVTPKRGLQFQVCMRRPKKLFFYENWMDPYLLNKQDILFSPSKNGSSNTPVGKSQPSEGRNVAYFEHRLTMANP